MGSVAGMAYRAWPTCYRLRNDSVEAVVAADAGPRIIRFGFAGVNELGEFPDQLGRTGGDEFRLYGGNRMTRQLPPVPALPHSSASRWSRSQAAR